MAHRVPRGYERNIPYYREISEGVRPSVQDLPLKPYTGLAPVRIDEFHHDPIVLDPGTLVGIATGSSVGAGKLLPCTFVTGGAGIPSGVLTIGDASAATNFGLPNSVVQISCGIIKPIGVIYQPVYSAILETRYTNYKRTDSVGVLCDYVISIPAINSEEVLIDSGDVIMAGSGAHHGLGSTPAYNAGTMLAGRYAKYSSSAFLAQDRIVGRCLKRLLLGTKSSPSAGDLLSDAISAGTFTISSAAEAEFASLAMVQTVPGLGNSGSGTSGIPSYLLGARCNSAGEFYALTLLIRL